MKKAYDLKLKALRRHQISEFISDADNKSKVFWTVINQEQKRKNTYNSIETLKVQNNIITSPHKIAHHLNEHFTTIAEKTLTDHQHSPSK